MTEQTIHGVTVTQVVNQAMHVINDGKLFKDLFSVAFDKEGVHISVVDDTDPVLMLDITMLQNASSLRMTFMTSPTIPLMPPEPVPSLPPVPAA